jgi:hypothetical protein
LERIISLEALPPRQIDDSIPDELQRICLRALEKSVNKRYPTALDFANELRAFASPEGISVDTIELADPPRAAFTPVTPNGLRSYSEADSNFYLQLLPDPKDRLGVPTNIVTWKRRIESLESEDSFRVGLIYGPSGCGKSSWLKAGLLLRLNHDIAKIYIEATPQGTELRLHEKLVKQL